MNLTQFRAMLELGTAADGPVELPIPNPTGERVYGGQMLAQLIAAAAGSGGGKRVKSLHVAFQREARPRNPLFMELETTHDGRSLGFRRAIIWQDAEPGRRIVATASILLDHPDAGQDYQLQAAVPGDPMSAKPVELALVPGETRLVGDFSLDDATAAPAEFSFWMRCPRFDDESLAQPVLAYVSDWPLIGTLIKPIPGVSERDAHITLQTGVVAHSLWFHQPFDVSQWLRVEASGNSLSGGRGFGTGEVYTQQGLLVASFAQQSVIRTQPS